jgi:GMP synthase-like glutamine amidotransferase
MHTSNTAKILGIQFRTSDSSIKQERNSLRRELGPDITVDFLSALDHSVDWQYPEVIVEKYDGIVLGGSGDFDFDGNRSKDDVVRKISYEILGRLRPLFTYIFEHDVPTLGICYGHQILGAFAGAQVKYSPEQRKTRSHEVRLLIDKNDYFIFSDLPETFLAHYGHKDVVDRVPEGATLLIQGGQECQVSALQYKKNIYTVQFHPELRFVDMIERVKNSPGYLPEGVAIEEIFKDDPSSNTILRNFGRLVVSLSEQANSQVLLSVE